MSKTAVIFLFSFGALTTGVSMYVYVFAKRRKKDISVWTAAKSLMIDTVSLRLLTKRGIDEAGCFEAGALELVFHGGTLILISLLGFLQVVIDWWIVE